MKLNLHRHLPIALLLSALSTPAIADSATSIHAAKINSANELVRNGEFAKALENYNEIPVTDLTEDELNYNTGVALYRQGDVDSARALFTTASTSTNHALAAAARYNLGNCSYSDAVASAEQDKATAIHSLNQAITQYRASLRANPNHIDARANIELAVALRTKLEEEQKQQQEQQEQQESEQDQNSEQQESDREKSKSGQDQESEPPSSEDSDSADSEKQDDSQSSAEENNKPEEQTEQQSDGQPNEQEGDESEPSEDESQSAENGQSEQPPKSASQDENSKPQSSQESRSETDESAADDVSEQTDDVVPSGELKPASEQQQNEGTQDTFAVSSGNEELMTREEALKMLQSVRDRDMLRRLRQEQAERSRHVPTDRDW